MTVAILSDIHGNLPALEAVVADARGKGCTAFVNLGDILSGPLWPRETADYLMAHDWPTIRGNHERQLLTQSKSEMGSSDAYALERLSQPHLNWMESLPVDLQLSDEVYLCHGTPESDLHYFLESVDEDGARPATAEEVEDRAAGRADRLVLCGHTHTARVVEYAEGRVAANPGSVGLPAYSWDVPFNHVMEAGSPHARYAILDGRRVELRAVAYDHEAAAAQADRNGSPDWAHALRHGRVPAS